MDNLGSCFKPIFYVCFACNSTIPFSNMFSRCTDNGTEINALVNGTYANGKKLASTFKLDEPEEADILGSLRASTCVNFNILRAWLSGPSNEASPIQLLYLKASLWCNDSSGVAFANNQVPRQLSPGLFLICGNRAWAGLPSNMMGRPCTIGRLTTCSKPFYGRTHGSFFAPQVKGESFFAP